MEHWRTKLALAVVASSMVVVLSACSKGPPPQLPTTAVRDRAACRVELVSLVIDDAARAARVRALYEQMDTLILAAKKAQAEQLRLLADPSATRTDDEKRARFAEFSATEHRALEAYVGLQMELRRQTTSKEFARLDAIK